MCDEPFGGIHRFVVHKKTFQAGWRVQEKSSMRRSLDFVADVALSIRPVTDESDYREWAMENMTAA